MNKVLTACRIKWLAIVAIMSLGCTPVLTQTLLPSERDRNFDYCFSVNGFEYDTLMTEPVSIAVDARKGRIYVADAKADRILVLSLQGIPQKAVGKGNVKSPVSLAVDKAGNLYIAESDSSQIKIIDSKGEVSSFGIPAEDAEKSPRPGRMTVDYDDNLYVVDKTSQRILVFDKERKLKLKIGERGSKRGQFGSLQDVAVDRQGRIYALDSEGTPVQVFDGKGKYIYRFGFKGDGLEDVSLPSGIFTDQNGQVWIVDRGQHCLKVFDRSGTFLRKFGTYGTENGKLFQPVDAEIDNFGRVYVLEAGAKRLQGFALSRPYEPLVPAF